MNETEKNAIEQKYLAQMEQVKKSRDIEARHKEADTILINLLRELGFNKIADSYEDEELDKWHA